MKEVQPSAELATLLSMPWANIFTTNFDDLVQKAFAKRSDADLYVFNHERGFDSLLPSHTPLYALHGSIAQPLTRDVQLVLTRDDLRRTSSVREAMYHRLSEDIHARQIVYIGSSLGDPDFGDLIGEIVDATPFLEQLPRGYAFMVNVPDLARGYWEQRKITLFDARMEEFVAAIERLRSGREKVQPIQIGAHAAFPRFLSDIDLTSPLAADLSAAFIFPETAEDQSNPSDFFRGAAPTWKSIRERYDAPRDKFDALLDIVLVGEADEPPVGSQRQTRFTFVDGPAGTGKTTLLKRLAWDLTSINQPVVWLRHPTLVQLDLIEELLDKAQKRVYVFVDNAADTARQLLNIISRSRTRRLQVSFILADRRNEWRAEARSLSPEPDDIIALGRMSAHEVDLLLERLERAGELGTLKSLPKDEQRRRLTERSGRHMLVALREATEGRAFDEIVVDEFENIPTETGKAAYLQICALYQFGVVTRAGLLSRATLVPIADLGERVLQPTIKVIIEHQTRSDWQPTYAARHEEIAKIVFRRRLDTSLRRAKYIQATLDLLDVGYRDDQRAFSQLVSARWLRLIVRDADLISAIYAHAKSLRPDDPFVTQQEALSLRRHDPRQAARLMREARAALPSSSALRHSDLTLQLDRARAAEGSERVKLLAAVAQAFKDLIALERNNPAPYTSLIDLYHYESRRSSGEESVAQLNEAQRVLKDAFKYCRSDRHLLEISARVEESLGKLDIAVEDFEKAVGQASGEPIVWQNYAAFLLGTGVADQAVKVLNRGLDIHPADPTLSYSLARSLEIAEPGNDAAIRSAYQAALAEPVRGHEPELDYAIYLFLNGNEEEANEHFLRLRNLDLSFVVRTKIRRWIKDDGQKRSFDGFVCTLSLRKAEVRVDDFNTPIFVVPSQLPFTAKRIGTRLSVFIGFNAYGPIAEPSQKGT